MAKRASVDRDMGGDGNCHPQRRLECVRLRGPLGRPGGHEPLRIPLSAAAR